MKLLCFIACCLVSATIAAQSSLVKSYPVTSGQPISLNIEYPVVRISTWDKNEVSVTAQVNINDHENDDAYQFTGVTKGEELVISDQIKDMNKLPRRYTLYQNGKKTVFKSKDEYKAAQKSGSFERSSEGTDIDIVLEIKVPAKSPLTVKAVYGIVEMSNFNAPVIVDATYGGIDATIATASTGKLKATTSYGQIYSNLDMKITDHAERDFFTSITAEPGKGPSYSLTSTYGKIYLRKP